MPLPRREFLKLAAGAALTGSARRAWAQPAGAPAIGSSPDLNILYLHCHDAGRVLGPYQPSVPTPALRALAGEACCFTNAHSAAPTCSPSRAAMLTGVSPHECGMLGLVNRGFRLGHPEWHLAGRLRAAGYRTVLSGIQHEFDPAGPLPYDDVLRPAGNRSLARDLRAARAAADWLASRPRGPFFLNVGFFWPHREWPAAPAGVAGDPAAFPIRLPDEPRVRRDMADFCGAAAVMDAGCRLVLDALAQSGLRERTIVLFTTDHGVPFPGGKCQLRDAGTGVTLLIDFPKNPARGQRCAALVSHLDVVPTLHDLAHLPAAPWQRGRSLQPLFERPEAEHRASLFSEVNWHAAYEPGRSIRTTRWRYVRHFDSFGRTVLPNIDDSPSKTVFVERGGGNLAVPREELFDLHSDPGEANNLAANPAQGGMLADLRRQLDQWMKETNDPLLTRTLPLAPPHGVHLNPQQANSPKDPVIDY